MKRDFYICELAWTPTPDPAAKSCCGAVAPRIISLPPTLPAERSRQSARTLAPLETRRFGRRSKNRQKRNTVRLKRMALALSAHLGGVVHFHVCRLFANA